MSKETLEQLQAKHPDLNDTFLQLINLFENKFWHQFGEALLVLSYNESVRNSDEILLLFNSIVNNSSVNINPVILSRLAICACLRLNCLPEQLTFLQEAIDSLHDKQAIILLDLQKAYCNFEGGELGKAGEILKEEWTNIENLMDTEKFVFATYYRYTALFHLKQDHYAEFYHYSLQFLAYVDQENFSQKEREELCVTLGIAILISPKIFNFSELLELEVFSVLKEGENSWIYKLMETYNSGNVTQFAQDVQNFNTQITNIEVLNSNMKTLEEKIKIMAFTELIFSLQKDERVVSFQQISDRTTLSLDMIEFMVLRAMSLELLKGKIDQVEQKVSITFIQPRVLDKKRIGMMRNKFETWETSLTELLGVITEYQTSLN